MTQEELYEKCAGVLKAQLETLRRISLIQQKIKDAALNKKWVDFEGGCRSADECSKRLSDLEKERFFLMEGAKTGNLKSREKFNFYSFTNDFPKEKRAGLNDLRRAVKHEASRVRFTNDALNRYLNSQISLVSGVLEAAFPDRRGVIYGRKGKTRNSDMRSIVLNRSF
ncbi:MAG: hypothetical protein LBC53_05350 [Spirochaetaceae bacterium]|jgi:hypothetical protein|nr:hypothetical protein [Spirochaetaceae bacterium]